MQNEIQSLAADLLLLVISSPSGAGKTTLTRRLLAQFPELTFSVSHTTRAPRQSEVDGQDYYFVNQSDFVDMQRRGAFAEWAQVHTNLYGTSVSELERAKRQGHHGIVFDVDYQGARQIKCSFPHAVSVFILPPSMHELKRRLHSRGLDAPEVIERRYQKALVEIEHYAFFDYLIVNHDLAQADAELCGIVYAERCRRRRRAAAAERLLLGGEGVPPVTAGL
ncbi:MAG: guanylate kinase [Polyangiales bacterium]